MQQFSGAGVWYSDIHYIERGRLVFNFIISLYRDKTENFKNDKIQISYANATRSRGARLGDKGLNLARVHISGKGREQIIILRLLELKIIN